MAVKIYPDYYPAVCAIFRSHETFDIHWAVWGEGKVIVPGPRLILIPFRWNRARQKSEDFID